jgi:hypothetical protein
VLAVGYDLQVFFTAVGKPPQRVSATDVLAFVAAQYTGARVDRVQVAAPRMFVAAGQGRASAADSVVWPVLRLDGVLFGQRTAR